MDDLTTNLKIEKENDKDKIEWDKLPKGLEPLKSAPSAKQDDRLKLKGVSNGKRRMCVS